MFKIHIYNFSKTASPTFELIARDLYFIATKHKRQTCIDLNSHFFVSFMPTMHSFGDKMICVNVYFTEGVLSRKGGTVHPSDTGNTVDLCLVILEKSFC